MIRLVFFALLGACTVEAPEECPAYLISERPSLELPDVWYGANDERQAIVIMTPLTYQTLVEQMHEARNWMRRADNTLRTCE